MGESKKLKRSKEDPTQVETARVGYETAINVWLYELEVAMARFDSMLVANSIVIASIAAMIASERQPPLPAWPMIALSLLGMLLCGVWFQVLERNLDYRWLWFYSAMELEQNYLSDPLKMLSRVKQFSEPEDDELVEFDLEGIPKSQRRIGRIGRLLKTRGAARLVILLFSFIYLVLLIYLTWERIGGVKASITQLCWRLVLWLR